VLVSSVRLVPVHLNLTVADPERSVAFYRRWFGFDRGRRDFPDGYVVEVYWEP
jgi:catechol 2,3-dioxygenase-like lactoylglutathione lyase family enzyme